MTYNVIIPARNSELSARLFEPYARIPSPGARNASRSETLAQNL